ncbi:MAG: RdgB/HAM1 family non-canonical purine NTP pyrophosphatase [Clostridiales bacterium]|nr:RdgB/HAM1 family non-canonical purine NTP pyrophosphatase [Clostridiales bacterium]
MEILLASENAHKLEELSRILKPLGFDVVTPRQKGIDLGLVEETGDTLIENSRIKANNARKISGMPVIADDTGLIVEALGGLPGVHTARFAGENATDKENVDKLLNEMKNVPKFKRAAKFVTSICCILSDSITIEVEGECKGEIAFERSGDNGFGYDPVFICEKYGRTFANCTAEEKDSVSHRGNALRKLKDKLIKVNILNEE